jgi:hypothetical protein
MDAWTRSSLRALRWVLSSPRALLVMNGLFAFVAAFNVYRLFGPTSYQIYQADFHTYYQAALAVRAGHNPFAPAVAWMQATLHHRPDTPPIGHISLYVYPPLLAIALIPFTIMPYPAALAVWNLCNIALLIGSCYFTLRIAAIRPSRTIMLGLIAAALSLSPVHSELFFAQVDLALLFLLCATLWAMIAQRPYLAGCLLAVACVIKPVLLVALPFVIWKRGYRAAAVGGIGFLVLLLLPFIWLGGGALVDQLAIWQFWSNQYVVYFFNVSPKGVFARLFQENAYIVPLVRAPALATGLWLAVALAVTALVALLIARAPLVAGPRTALECGIAVTALLIISPLSEDWYFCFLIVPLFACGFALRASPWSRRGLGHTAALIAIDLLLCLPLFHIQSMLLDHLSARGTPRLVADALMIASAVQLYLAISLLVLQVLMLRELTAVSLRARIGHLVSFLMTWLRQSRPSPAPAASQARAALRGAQTSTEP